MRCWWINCRIKEGMGVGDAVAFSRNLISNPWISFGSFSQSKRGLFVQDTPLSPQKHCWIPNTTTLKARCSLLQIRDIVIMKYPIAIHANNASLYLIFSSYFPNLNALKIRRGMSFFWFPRLIYLTLKPTVHNKQRADFYCMYMCSSSGFEGK